MNENNVTMISHLKRKKDGLLGGSSLPLDNRSATNYATHKFSRSPHAEILEMAKYNQHFNGWSAVFGC